MSENMFATQSFNFECVGISWCLTLTVTSVVPLYVPWENQIHVGVTLRASAGAPQAPWEVPWSQNTECCFPERSVVTPSFLGRTVHLGHSCWHELQEAVAIRIRMDGGSFFVPVAKGWGPLASVWETEWSETNGRPPRCDSLSFKSMLFSPFVIKFVPHVSAPMTQQRTENTAHVLKDIHRTGECVTGYHKNRRTFLFSSKPDVPLESLFTVFPLPFVCS